MAKRVVLLSLLTGALVLGLVGTTDVWGKAHVPLGRAQICTANGQVKNVASRLLQARLNQGACRLTACVFNDVEDGEVVQQFIFLPGDSCDPTDADGDGFCDAVGAPSEIARRLKANNVTPACTDPY